MTRSSSRSSAESTRAGSIFGVSSLRRPEQPITESEAAGLAAEHWGLKATAGRLAAEVDENFRLDSPTGTYLLKVVPADEDGSLTELVTEALLHLEAGGGIDVPRVVATTSGDRILCFEGAAGDRRRARLTTFIEGRTLRSAELDDVLRRRIGSTLARLALCLRDFDHPGADRDLSWDLRHAGRMLAMLEELGPTPRRAALAACLEDFDAVVVPRLEPLPAQIVHNDLSRDNAVLTPTGDLGVIDFGDIVRTHRVNDLAVAMADQVEAGPDPLEPALDLAAGYVEVTPLDRAEIDLLPPLVRTRVATRIVGGEWRAARFPENRDYLARNVERLWEVFASLSGRPGSRERRLLEALEEPR